MSDPLVLISPNAIAREGLCRIIAAADFEIVGTGPAAENIEWSAFDDEILTVIDAGSGAPQAEAIGEVRDRHPEARCVVLVDEFDFNGMLQCFDQQAQGYIVKDMPCSPLITSLRLASQGERILPPGLLDMVLSQPTLPSRGKVQDADRANLSQREFDVLCCLTAGHSNKVIARQLHVSEATIKVHVKAILRKLKIDNRTQAAMWATSRGICPDTIAARSN